MYRCNTFHTFWEGDNCILDFDHQLVQSSPGQSPYYNISVFNILGTVNFCKGALNIPDSFAIRAVNSDPYTGSTSCNLVEPANSDGYSCDPTTSTNCSFTCEYDAFHGAYPLVAFGEQVGDDDTYILWKNFTYPINTGRMFTPEFNNTDLRNMDEEFYPSFKLSQWCSEFEMISGPVVEDTCTSFTSETIIQNVNNGSQCKLVVTLDYVNDCQNKGYFIASYVNFGSYCSGFVIDLGSTNSPMYLGGPTNNNYTYYNGSRIINLDSTSFYTDLKLEMAVNLGIDNVVQIHLFEFYMVEDLLDPSLSVNSTFYCSKFSRKSNASNTPCYKCPNGWHQSSIKNLGKCYKFFYTKDEDIYNFDYDHICENAATLGNGLTIESAFENNDVRNLFQSTPNNCGSIWLDLFYDDYYHTWNWTQTPYHGFFDNSTYRNWQSGYPVVNENQTDVSMDLTTGLWSNSKNTRIKERFSCFDVRNRFFA
uniref:C-type lectin domain-containing protein n=1 Tax=Acrobeloides nanus TaxID=290746 RepID=A0A914ECS9_9BILA